MPNEFLQVSGAIALVALIIRELFTFLKARNHYDSGMNKQIFQELQTMNNNHLHSIQDAIEQGNRDMVRTMNEGQSRQIQLLGEIKGILSARK